MVCSRLDVAYAISMVSRFMSNPGKIHWDSLKGVLRHAKGFIDYRLRFGITKNYVDGVEGFVDSDFARNIDTRKFLQDMSLDSMGFHQMDGQYPISGGFVHN